MTTSTPFWDLLRAQSTTWDRRLYFPSEGRRAEDFSALEIRLLRPGLNPRTRVPEGSTLKNVRWSEDMTEIRCSLGCKVRARFVVLGSGPTNFYNYPIWNHSEKKNRFNTRIANPGRQVAVATVRWRLIFVGPRYGTCFLSSFWALNFEVAPRDL